MIAGTSYVGFLAEDFPAAAKVEFEAWPEMLAAVKSGALAALLYDEIEIGNWRLADPAGALELRPYQLEGRPDTIAIAIRRGEDDLLDWIDLYLEKVRDNGELEALLDSLPLHQRPGADRSLSPPARAARPAAARTR